MTKQRGFLTMTRKDYEGVAIGEVVVRVRKDERGRMKLDVFAPKEVPIRRLDRNQTVEEIEQEWVHAKGYDEEEEEE